MADSYVEALLSAVEKEGDEEEGKEKMRRPFVVGGYSFGAAVAIEMCLRLQQVI